MAVAGSSRSAMAARASKSIHPGPIAGQPEATSTDSAAPTSQPRAGTSSAPALTVSSAAA